MTLCALRVAHRAAALLASAALFAHAAWAQCPLASGPARPQPAWVGGSAAPEGNTVSAAGVAELRGAASLDAARDAARSRALAELAQQIQADVRASLVDSLNKVTEAGRTRVSESFVASTEVQSRLSLRDARVAEQWTDVGGCRLWVRVQVPRAEAERARAAATSDAAAAGVRERIAQAADTRRGAAERAAALAEARELARLADPALTPGYSRDAFELQAAELGGTLTAQRDREGQYREAITRHVQALAQANASPAGPARRAAANRALAALESAQALAPGGVPGFTLPFSADDRLATLYGELNAPCVGRQWFERRNLAVPAALAARAAACDAPQLAKERRALFLDGKTVALDCTLLLAGSAGAWPKACTLLQNSLVADGAVLVAAGAAAEVRIELRAEGVVQERKAAEGAREAWRFQGKLRSVARGSGAAGQLNLADDYEGLTGWNPVSAQMATDLLALSAVKRLETGLNAYWDKP